MISTEVYQAIGCYSTNLYHLGKVQSLRKCFLHKLNNRQIERPQAHAESCSPYKKESRSFIGLWLVMKSGYIFKILNARNRGLIPVNHQHLPQDKIASDKRRCFVFGMISRVSFTMSYWNLVKLLIQIANFTFINRMNLVWHHKIGYHGLFWIFIYLNE